MWLRGRGSPWRPAAAVIATVSMMLATVMGPHFAGMRAQAVEPVQTTTIPHTKITGDGNYFTFADNAWDPGNDVHTWSKAPSDSLPAEDIWYTVRFFGSAIDVYAGKNRPMGKVKYYIDGAEKGTYSLYNASNINETKIASFTGLDEGEHVFKAVATGERDTNSTNALIDCAKVVVTHQPYVVTGVTLDTTSMTLGVGDSKRISYTVAPDYATIDDMTYTSGDTSVATVGADGTVTAVAPGATAITVASTAAGISKTVDVTVARMAPNLTGGIVDPDTQYTQKRFDEVKALTTNNRALKAWKNDKVNSEISLAAVGTTVSNLTVTASDLTSQGGDVIAKSNVTATFIKSTRAYNGSYLGYGDPNREVPAATETNRSESNDILYQSGPITVKANQVQNIWVSFAIPKDAKAGTYTTTLTATADGMETPLTFTYTIEVKAATLPDPAEYEKNFDVELWQYPYSSAEYYGVTPFSDEHLQILRSSMELYKSIGGHAITTTINEDAWSGQTYSANAIHYPSMVKWTKSGGGFTYDFTDFDKWVTFNKGLGIGDKIVIYSIAPWHGNFTYWENGTMKSEKYTVGSERWRSVWTDFLRKLIEHLMDKGWFDESYIGIDERGFSADAFDLIDSIRNIHDVPLKTAGAMDGFVNKFDLALRVTDLNVGDTAAAAHPTDFTRLIEAREAKGLRTTLYSCTEHEPGNFSLSAPVESYWSVVNAGEQTSGFLRWAYDAWVADPLNDATHNAFEPGDPFLIYPSEKSGDKVSKSSVRLERIAEGVRDVNKIRLMVTEIPSLQADADAMYAKIRTTVTTSHSYLTAAQVTQLANEMSGFKGDLDTLTDKYISLKAQGTSTVESVAIDGGDQEIMLGTAKQLTATLKPANLLNASVTWRSSKTGVATVSAKGVVTAAGVGSTTITATSKADPTKSASITLTVTPQVVAQGLHYYSFDDSNANDSWGTRNGTADATAQYVDGKSGKALKVTDGKGVTLAGGNDIAKTDPWTIGYWVRSDAELTGRSAVMTSADGKYSADLKMDADRESGFRVGTASGDVLTFRHDFQPGTWYYIAWTQDKAAGLTMYVNGTKIGATNTWTKMHDVVAPIDVIGGPGFTGLIDEVKIYKRVLSDTEIAAGMLLPGLNLAEHETDMYIGGTYTIVANLQGGDGDGTVTFESSDPTIAKVDASGTVTGVSRGTAVITVRGGGFTDMVTVNVSRELTIKNTLPQYKLDQTKVTDVHKSLDTSNQYFGQPDMIRTKSGRLITSFPQGHGKGPLIMKISDDDGATWTRKTDIPASWAGSQETPTLYVLNLADGTERIMMITACPGWGTDSAGNRYGWNTSYSDDNGETWTEYRHWQSNRTYDNANNDAIVAMASLVQLKDSDGNDIQKWMGVYHNYAYVNFRTYLTFDENGDEQWSESEPYLAQWRSIESAYQMCEIGMFRSPDGKRIIGLARSQSHNNPATLIYSDDEGETWSKPMDLPGSLAGERHKIAYDPISGRLLVTFREINYDLNGNNRFDGGNDWNAGDWVAWVGTYDQLINQEDGEYRILLAEDWANNAKSGDTGYAGVAVLDDGTFIMDTYGHWDKEFSQNWPGGVTTDRCYIKQAKFKLGEVEYANGLIDRSGLKAAIKRAEALNAADYTADSWAKMDAAVKAAKAGDADESLQQAQVDALAAAIDAAIDGLKPAETPDPDPGKVSKDELNAVIAQVKAKDLGGYTDESVRAVCDALAAAEKVSADPDATQAEIDAALASLNAAVDGLKAKDDGDKPGPGDGGKPGAGDGKPGDGKPDPGKPGKGDETKPDTGEKGGLSATGAGIVPIAAAALTLMAGAALALAKR